MYHVVCLRPPSSIAIQAGFKFDALTMQIVPKDEMEQKMKRLIVNVGDTFEGVQIVSEVDRAPG